MYERGNKISLIFTIFSFFLIGGNLNAQNNSRGNWCATDQKAEALKRKDPSIIQKEADFRAAARAYIANNPVSKHSQNDKTSPYIIPVVFHCITDLDGSGWVSKADIDDAILTLNEDFSRTNTDAANTRAPFIPVAGGMNIEFRLAHLDPNNNCTQGIVRAKSSLSTNAGDAVKALSQWNEHKYFNIWVVNTINSASAQGTILGYAYKAAYGLNNVFGVIIRHDEVGRNKRTLTHEIGHCFNLDHTFNGSGCGSSCSTSGDWICDTPPSTVATFGCATTQNTCSNDASGPSAFSTNVVDQIENYMSYDQCQNMFSLEQIAFMQQTLDNTSFSVGLDQLNTSANHTSTGVANPYIDPICVPIADFNYDKEYICEGASVAFTDNSYNATPTTWNWTFIGGNPNTSSVSNPTIVYNTAGVYGVTHQPGTTAGSGTHTKNSIITVSSLTADYSGVIVDGFENPAQFNTDWRIENPEGQPWQRTTFAASTGSSSVRIRNSVTTSDGEVDELISPSYDLSSVSIKTLTFKYAFVKKNSANSDRMIVYSSTDCGETWQLKSALVGSAFPTGSNNTGVFNPSPSDFVEKVVDLTSLANETNVRFKFAFQSGGGNDMYLDDINIGGTVGIDGFSNVASFNVYPNPATSNAKISFNLINDIQKLNIRVKNALGQEVTSIINEKSFSAGKYTLNIDEERKLSKGLYFVEFNADDNVRVQKFIVQ